MFTISWRQEKPSGIGLRRQTHTHTIHTHVPAGVVIWELYERVWCTKFQSSGIFTSVSVGSSPRSYLFTSAKVRMVFTLHQSMAQNLSDMSRYFETGEAQFRSVTEIAPKSPFLCVNRRPTRYDSCGGAKAIQFGVN